MEMFQCTGRETPGGMISSQVRSDSNGSWVLPNLSVWEAPKASVLMAWFEVLVTVVVMFISPCGVICEPDRETGQAAELAGPGAATAIPVEVNRPSAMLMASQMARANKRMEKITTETDARFKAIPRGNFAPYYMRR